MEAIVLAGGFGTRLRSVIADTPKPMAPIGGRPFLEILLTILASKGFTRVILSVGYLGGQIIAHFGAEFQGITLEYEIEETPLGTGGAIVCAMRHCHSDHAFIFNGDTYLDLEANVVEQHWRRYRNPIIVARQVPDSSRYGGLDVVNGQVVDFSEKGLTGPGLINAGCYIFPTDLLVDADLPTKFSIESDFLIKSVHTRRYDCFVTEGMFIDIGIPDDYAHATTVLRGTAKPYSD